MPSPSSQGVLIPFSRRASRRPLHVLLVDTDDMRAAEMADTLKRDTAGMVRLTIERSVDSVRRHAAQVEAIVVGLGPGNLPTKALAKLVEDAANVPIITVGGRSDPDAHEEVACAGIQQHLPARCAFCREMPSLLATILWAIERAALHAQLEDSRRLDHYLALHDELTDLPNLRLYHDRFELLLAQARRTGKHVALLLIDLDGFKVVNDRHGHLVGDTLLREAAERMRRTVRETDTVARRGGDEFAVLLDDVSGQQDVPLAARKVAKALARPYRIDGRTITSTASIGIALCPWDGLDIETLEGRADTALYQVKERGGNDVQRPLGEGAAPPPR